MAQKRMFDRAIIDTDKFMDLPIGTKAIYFLLGMEADDEGFVSYKKVMRIHGGSEDDIKVLTAKGFVIQFPSGVVVITDWNKNNWLDNRRIKPTEYQNEKKLLVVNTDKTYSLSNGLASAQLEESRGEENSKESEAKAPQEFVWDKYLNDMINHKRKDLNIIGFFFKTKGIEYNTKAKAEVAIRRHLRAAKELSVFDKSEIGEKIRKLNYDFPKFTLETVIKELTK